MGSRDEEWSLRLSRDNKIVLLILCGVNGCRIAGMRTDFLIIDILRSVFAGCLLAASVMDWWERMVYRFVWWVAGAAAGLSFLWEYRDYFREGDLKEVLGVWMPLVGFIALQQLFFSHFYGRADSHAFSVCAVMFAACGGGYVDYLTHMAIAFGGLGVIQLARGNVALNGRLKRPVPLVPYVTAAFWLGMTLFCRTSLG